MSKFSRLIEEFVKVKKDFDVPKQKPIDSCDDELNNDQKSIVWENISKDYLINLMKSKYPNVDFNEAEFVGYNDNVSAYLNNGDEIEFQAYTKDSIIDMVGEAIAKHVNAMPPLMQDYFDTDSLYSRAMKLNLKDLQDLNIDNVNNYTSLFQDGENVIFVKELFY